MFSILDQVFDKYITPDQKRIREAQRSNFYLYEDKAVQLKKDLEAAGFTGIKIWEQPMNIMFRTGQEYMAKVGDARCMDQAESLNLTDEQIQKVKAEVAKRFEEETGSSTTDLKAF